MRSRTIPSRILRRLTKYADGAFRWCQDFHHNQELSDSSIGAAKSIPTHMTRRELGVLHDLAANVRVAGNVLEIGSYLGASSCYLAGALSLRNGRLYCVDTWKNQTMPEGERDTYAEFRRNISGVADHITPLRKRSDELEAHDVALPLDLVFIDADHSYAAVRADCERVRDWVIDGGILALHDCTCFESVSRVLGEILASGSWQIAGNVDSLVWLRRIGSAFRFSNPMGSVPIPPR
jgi:predicted O-methyltransferase YrrM